MVAISPLPAREKMKAAFPFEATELFFRDFLCFFSVIRQDMFGSFAIEENMNHLRSDPYCITQLSHSPHLKHKHTPNYDPHVIG